MPDELEQAGRELQREVGKLLTRHHERLTKIHNGDGEQAAIDVAGLSFAASAKWFCGIAPDGEHPALEPGMHVALIAVLQAICVSEVPESLKEPKSCV